MAAETSQTLDRGLRVLSLLAEQPEGMTVTELAAALGVSRTVVYRLVVTLEQHGLLRRGADGRCRLGLAVLGLSRHVQPLLRDAALPALRRLSDGLGATSYLLVLDGTEGLTVAVVEPTRVDVHVASRVGARVPLDRGAGGRALQVARAGRVAADPGWVAVAGDPLPGALGVAAALPGVPGVDACVGVVVVGDPDPAEVGPRVLRAAADIARALR
ncbi:MAG: helix-turn-helix domain-containing protein [Candidatus Nanopelagicales bacterium]